MGTLFNFAMHVILWPIVLFLVFTATTNIDLIFYAIKKVLIKIKEYYEFIRKRICKKSNKVDDDGGAIRDYAEFYDSSSVWED